MAQPVLHRAPAVATRLPGAATAPGRHHVALPAGFPALEPRRVDGAEPVAAVPSVPAAPVRSAAPAAAGPDIHVGSPDYGVRTVEFRPGSETAIALAAARADVIRLEFSVAVPTVGALARVVALVEEAVADAGRDRAEVRVVLDLEVVLASDERTARRKRSHLEYLDALSGLGWSPAATRVVTTPALLAAEVRELARRAGVDGVVLLPLAGGPAAEDELRALVA
ncbi:hypothetical protein [Cellulomonas sp. ES6]|uniref:hypothetical protein n=1 Tax=Cellulomonas sp. ES6 TaxID=3039384 RepID=UPI0024B7634F|nr:hypothetical protein [Cellulomonas sp. ES6]WHP16774.1 hypothetical protein P9841_14295 [Cellulomonas sp. ES6]